MKTTKEKVEIMLAFDRGEKVEWIRVGDLLDVWTLLPPDEEPVWAWEINDYRIAEKPKETIKMLCWTDGETLTWGLGCYPLDSPWKRFPVGDKEGEVGE